MLLAEAGCLFVGFILCFSGVQGRAKRICALKGSSVDLPCSAEHPTTTMKWYKVQPIGSTFNLKNLPADDSHVKYNMSEESNFNLTIKDLTESDEKLYCCSSEENAENPRTSEQGIIELRVADLQVKVIPSTEGHTVTLMCSTSCPLTENPAAYIWYKNREFLYEDWSPWYQQLVSSEEAVRYSCAIKGYEDLRAPEVSVDSVTSACFSVTYAKGRMCFYKQRSEDEPCSITYPTEVHVQKTLLLTDVRLTCHTSCALTDSQTAYTWYRGGVRYFETQQYLTPSLNVESFFCVINGFKDLMSAEVCTKDKNCWSVNYVSRRICALEDSSVNISSKYSHPDDQLPKDKLWYKIKTSGMKDAEELIEAAGRVEYHDMMENHHILRINNLKKNDSAEYKFSLQRHNGERYKSDFPGVTLVATEEAGHLPWREPFKYLAAINREGLKVTLTPSAVVTEGQRVTLTCSTSCPLNTNYTWTFNGRPLILPENQNKQLVLDPVGNQHSGNYSCAVKTGKTPITSSEKTLTVQYIEVKQTAAAAGVSAFLLAIIALAVFFWSRRKRTSGQSAESGATDNTEQLNPDPLYGNISAQPEEQEDLHYCSPVHFSNTQTVPLYSTIQPHQPKEQEHATYAIVNFRSNTTPD